MKHYPRIAHTSHTKGFLTVATLILMMASLSIVLTLMYRSTQGMVIANTLKQSDQSYQTSDQEADAVIQKFRDVDDGSYNANGVDSTKKIPENIYASNVCDASVKCYRGDDTAVVADLTMLSSVYSLSVGDTANTTARFLKAPIPQRVSRPEVNNFSAIQNGAKVEVSWDEIADASGEYDKIEIRRATLSDTQKTLTPQAMLSDTSIDWVVVGVRKAKNTKQITDNDSKSSATTYAYTLKTTNIKLSMLDSPYVMPVLITIP